MFQVVRSKPGTDSFHSRVGEQGMLSRGWQLKRLAKIFGFFNGIHYVILRSTTVLLKNHGGALQQDMFKTSFLVQF